VDALIQADALHGKAFADPARALKTKDVEEGGAAQAKSPAGKPGFCQLGQRRGLAA
jgi:hypothetical protein